jgi:para-aminobenzoate synthetase component 1
MFQAGVQLNWHADPLTVLSRWPRDRGVFMLHSARPDPRWSRYSVLAEPTEALRFKDGRIVRKGAHREAVLESSVTSDPFSALRDALSADRQQSLWLGSLGYDLCRFIEQLPAPALDDRGWPAFQFERCAGWLVHDNCKQQWTAHGTYAKAPPQFLKRLDEQTNAEGTGGKFDTFSTGPIQADQSAEYVTASIQRAIDYIAAGDVFQVNLAQRFSALFKGNPRALYAALCEQSPAWYGAYGELTRFTPDEPKRTLASISPELFLEVDGEGNVLTRPIKGTRPSTESIDSLRESRKDRAELAMIVDLMRNDLGRVCRYGSIRVEDARTIESHPTVHHGVATIRGRLADERDLVDLLRATFPGGSITGAPKVRAMQIIDELEPAQRGAYCGAIGMIHGEQMTLNIAIRTIMLQQSRPLGEGRADVWVGGGIVADSEPDREYQEMLDKAKAMFDALGAGSLADATEHESAKL